MENQKTYVIHQKHLHSSLHLCYDFWQAGTHTYPLHNTVSSGSTATAYRFCKLQCNKIVMSKLGGQSQTVVKHLKNIYLLFLNFLLSLSSVLQQLLYEKQWSTQFDFSWNWVDLQGHSKVSFIRHLHVNIKIEYQSKAVNFLKLLNFCKNPQTNKKQKQQEGDDVH